MRGTVSLQATDEGIRILGDGDIVGTIREPDVDTDRWAVVSTPSGALYEVQTPPPTDADPGGWTVSRDGRVVVESAVALSSKVGLPVVLDLAGVDGTFRVEAGDEWRTWSLKEGERQLGEVVDADEPTVVLHHDVPLPVVLVLLANALAVADLRQRPWFLTARRMERKTKERLEKRHADAADEAQAGGHVVRYLSAWEDNVVLGWFECLRCGATASTFEHKGGVLARVALGFGGSLGRLRGDLLDTPCRPTNRVV